MLGVVIFAHRWLGVATCVLFTAWFASGLVMILVPFPSLSAGERAAARPAIDAGGVTLSPAEALDAATTVAGAEADTLSLIALPTGEPVYIATAAGMAMAIDARDRMLRPALDAEDAAAIAGAFQARRGGLGAITAVDGPMHTDQWVVHQRFDPHRPVFRVSFDDGARTQLYVSAQTGEVLQDTTGAERGWNWAGAIIHWIYITPLRRHWAAWDAVVWWASLVCIIAAVLGVVLGVTRARWRPDLAGLRTVTPFRGWMRWHHLIGCVAALFVLTWIVSGWLSMDHGRLFSTPSPSQEAHQRYRGASLSEAFQGLAPSAFSAIESANALRFTVLAGEAVVIAEQDGGPRSYQLAQGVFRAAPIETALLEAAAAAAWPGATIESVSTLGDYDPYVHLVEGAPAGRVVRIMLGDDRGTWVHVAVSTGEILSVMDRSRRTYRWLYNGLHSFDIPALAARPVLRDALLFVFCSIGLVFSVTGLVLAARRLARDGLWPSVR